MRLVCALLLLMSLMTTHAVALERAAAKTGTGAAEIVTIVDTSERIDLVLSGLSGETTKAATPNRPCLQNGECLFLVPAHSFAGLGLVAAYGGRFVTHAHPISGRLIHRPPIG